MGAIFGMVEARGVEKRRLFAPYVESVDLAMASTTFLPCPLFHNEGATFSEVAAPFLGGIAPCIAWGDADNDGDLDLVEHGDGGFAILLNDGAGRFAGSSASSVAWPTTLLRWADFDGDGAFDLIAAGHRPFGQPYQGRTGVFKNYWKASEVSAARPEALVDGNQVQLRWPALTNFSIGPCTYNIRVGTRSQGVDIVSPLSDPTTGKRLVAAKGNVGFARNTGLNLLAPGTYFWSVQAINSSWHGSVWASEGTFTITESVPRPRIDKVEVPGPSVVQLTVSAAPGALISIDVSYDLLSWSEALAEFVGATGHTQIGLQADWPRAFYRVRAHL